eukprot:Nk52_evm2s2579 gene=Nk52_evmTU2s2579
MSEAEDNPVCLEKVEQTIHEVLKEPGAIDFTSKIVRQKVEEALSYEPKTLKRPEYSVEVKKLIQNIFVATMNSQQSEAEKKVTAPEVCMSKVKQAIEKILEGPEWKTLGTKEFRHKVESLVGLEVGTLRASELKQKFKKMCEELTAAKLAAEELKKLENESSEEDIEDNGKENMINESINPQKEAFNDKKETGNHEPMLNSELKGDVKKGTKRVKKRKTVVSDEGDLQSDDESSYPKKNPKKKPIKKPSVPMNKPPLDSGEKRFEDRIAQLKVYCRETGLRVIYKRELEGLDYPQQVKKLVQILNDNGVTNPITLTKCKAARAQRELLKDAEELMGEEKKNAEKAKKEEQSSNLLEFLGEQSESDDEPVIKRSAIKANTESSRRPIIHDFDDDEDPF